MGLQDFGLSIIQSITTLWIMTISTGICSRRDEIMSINKSSLAYVMDLKISFVRCDFVIMLRMFMKTINRSCDSRKREESLSLDMSDFMSYIGISMTAFIIRSGQKKIQLWSVLVHSSSFLSGLRSTIE